MRGWTLAGAVGSFLAGYRGETARAYAGDLRCWSDWWAAPRADLGAAARADIET